MQHQQMFTMPINAIWQSFQLYFLKSALETQMKAYAAFAYVQHAEKHYLAVFSNSTFKIYSKKANIGICSIRICSTCRKTLFGSVFIIIYKNLLQKRKYRHMQHSKMFNMIKNAIWQCFHNQLTKSTLESRINAYAAVPNVQHA